MHAAGATILNLFTIFKIAIILWWFSRIIFSQNNLFVWGDWLQLASSSYRKVMDSFLKITQHDTL